MNIYSLCLSSIVWVCLDENAACFAIVTSALISWQECRFFHASCTQHQHAALVSLTDTSLSPSLVPAVNKHKPWIETSYHGVITENTDIVLLDPPLVALDKDAPIPYAGTLQLPTDQGTRDVSGPDYGSTHTTPHEGLDKQSWALPWRWWYTLVQWFPNWGVLWNYRGGAA